MCALSSSVDCQRLEASEAFIRRRGRRRRSRRSRELRVLAFLLLGHRRTFGSGRIAGAPALLVSCLERQSAVTRIPTATPRAVRRDALAVRAVRAVRVALRPARHRSHWKLVSCAVARCILHMSTLRASTDSVSRVRLCLVRDSSSCATLRRARLFVVRNRASSEPVRRASPCVTVWPLPPRTCPGAIACHVPDQTHETAGCNETAQSAWSRIHNGSCFIANIAPTEQA